MTPVSFVKTTGSYKASLVTINRQTSYDSGINCQDNGIIRGLSINNTRLADLITIWIVHLLERTETGWPNYRIEPDCAGRA